MKSFLHKIYILLLIISFNHAYGQNENTLKGDGTESKGKRKGDWKLFYESGELYASGKYKNNLKTGTWKYFSKDGKVKASGNFLDNKKEGIWVELSLEGDTISGNYHQDLKNGKWTKISHGHIEEEAYFENNQLHGKYQSFYHSGNVEFEANYIKDSLSGIYRKYYENGKIAVSQQFTNNKRTGDYLAFFENGDTMTFVKYSNNLKSGIYRAFYSNKKLKETGVYQEDEKVGIWKMFDENGKLILQINAENGYQNRAFKFYNKGLLLAEGEFLNDKPYSAFKKYHSNGKHSMVAYYNAEGNLEDTLEEYFSDGSLYKSITFQNGTKTGDYKVYSQNGQLIKFFKFDHDEIQSIEVNLNNQGKPTNCYFTMNDSLEVYYQIDTKGKISKGERKITNPINKPEFEEEYFKNEGIIRSLQNELIFEPSKKEAFK